MNERLVIPEPNLENFAKGIKKLNKVADKLGCSHVTYEEVGEEFHKVKYEDEEVLMRFVEVQVTGESPSLNGYKLVAILERNRNLNMVKHVDREIPLPKGVEGLDTTCDHCCSKRFRKHIYLLWDTNKEEYIQVGKTCAKDFIQGHASPEYLAHYHSFLRELEEATEYVGGGYVVRYVESIDVLAFSIYLTEEEGYRDTFSNLSTKVKTLRSIYNGDFVTKEDVEAAGCYEKAKELIEWINVQDTSLDYFRNMQTLLKDKVSKESNSGILASAYHSYQKNLEYKKRDELKRKREEKPSEYVGSVGERKVYRLFYEREVSFATQFGRSYIYFFQDEQANVYVWKTGKRLWFKKGEEVCLTGTLKEHSEYDGIKQNVLTRCKL